MWMSWFVGTHSILGKQTERNKKSKGKLPKPDQEIMVHESSWLPRDDFNPLIFSPINITPAHEIPNKLNQITIRSHKKSIHSKITTSIHKAKYLSIVLWTSELRSRALCWEPGEPLGIEMTFRDKRMIMNKEHVIRRAKTTVAEEEDLRGAWRE